VITPTKAEGTYRYAFNGKEKDTDFQNNYDYGFRIYNPKIGKFLSVDPLTRSYPNWSPYPFAMNHPIEGVDLDGLEYVYYSVVNVDERTGEAVIEAIGEIDYGNWLMNLIHKTTGWTPMDARVNVVIAPDGRSYLFAPNEDLNSVTIDDFDPDERYTLDGIQALYNLTDALEGVMVGLNAQRGIEVNKPATPLKKSNRHSGTSQKAGRFKKEKNTLYDPKVVNYADDVASINAGMGQKIVKESGRTFFRLENGRVYESINSEAIPFYGPGIYRMNRSMIEAYQILQKNGLKNGLDIIKNMNKKNPLSESQLNSVIENYKTINGNP